MAITQKFIAEKANLSQKTVSQFFQGKARISQESRNRLENIVAQYGYFPNAAARSIRTKRFNRISCLLVYNVQRREQDILSPHLLNYINAIATELSDYGYSLVIEPFKVDSDHKRMLDSPESLNTLSVDGILGIVGGWIPPEVDKLIDKIDVPVVWLNRRTAGLNRPMINFDEKPGIDQLLDHLLEKGSKRIAWYGPDFAHLNGHHSSKERYELVISGLKKRGLKLYRTSFNSMGRTLCPSAFELFRKGQTPEAVICYNNGFRKAAENAAIYCNLRPGYDFECIHFASNWERTPSSYDCESMIMLPEDKVGRYGARYLYELIQGKEEKFQESFPTWLHKGKSFEENF